MLIDVPGLLSAMRIEATRKGVEWMAECPNPKHADSKPSWSIQDEPTSPRHGNHYCFGCHFGGGPIDLVIAVHGLSYHGARTWLEERGLIVGTDRADPGALKPVRVKLLDSRAGLRLPAGVVQDRPFRDWPGPLRAYLAKRGISAWQVAAHRIGFAIVGQQKNRVFFPSYDRNGRLLSYTGRSAIGESSIRYRSTDDLPGARPDQAVFGEHLWRYRSAVEVWVTEGAINALAVERALCDKATGEYGPAVAALSGSRLTEDHVAKLGKFERVSIVADSDDAGVGIEAAVRLESALLGSGQAVRVVVPPKGFDAAALSRDALWELLQ